MVPVLFTFYIQGVLKLKKKSGAKGLSAEPCTFRRIFSLRIIDQALGNLRSSSHLLLVNVMHYCVFQVDPYTVRGLLNVVCVYVNHSISYG